MSDSFSMNSPRKGNGALGETRTSHRQDHSSSARTMPRSLALTSATTSSGGLGSSSQSLLPSLPAPSPSAQFTPRAPRGSSGLFVRSLRNNKEDHSSRYASAGVGGGQEGVAGVLRTNTAGRANAYSAPSSGREASKVGGERSSKTEVGGLADVHDARQQYILSGVLNDGDGRMALSPSSGAANNSGTNNTNLIAKAASTAGMMEGWRSYTLDLEVALRSLGLMGASSLIGASSIAEMATISSRGANDRAPSSSSFAGYPLSSSSQYYSSSPQQPPTAKRIRKVFALFESFARASPHIETVLRLFKVEFARAIFEPLEQSARDSDGIASEFKNNGSEETEEKERDYTEIGEHDLDDVGIGSSKRFCDESENQPLGSRRSPRSSGSSGLDFMGTPYFDKVATLRREKAILATELDVIEAESSVEDLKKQVLRLQSLIPFYEQEISRLSRDAQSMGEELQKVKAAADAASQRHQKAYSSLEEDFQRLSRENRELLIEVQGLRKSEDAYGARGVTTLYNQMKSSKIDFLQHMFEAGNQEATMLLLSHQLESALNSALTEADRQYHRCSDADIHSTRAKLMRDCVLLLEEMHEVEERRSVLLVREEEKEKEKGNERRREDSEQQGTLTCVRERAHSKFQSLKRSREEGVREDGLTAGVPSRFEAAVSSGGALALPSSADARSAWVASAYPSLLPTPSARSVDTVVAVAQQSEPALSNVFNRHHADPTLVFSKRVTAPLADVSATKFMSGVEVHAVTPGGDLEYIQTVPYLDPAHSIELPTRSTHVRLKFMQPMRKDLRIRYGHIDRAGGSPDYASNKAFKKYSNRANGVEKSTSLLSPQGGKSILATIDTKNGTTMPERRGRIAEEEKPAVSGVAASIPKPAYIQGNVADREDVMYWLHEQLNLATFDSAKGRGAVSNVGEAAEALRRHAVSPMEGSHWSVYLKVFGEFRPFLPRLLPIEYIDSLLLRSFKRLMKQISSRYEQCMDKATGKTSSIQTARMYAERLFRELYRATDLQTALLETIEHLYIFPELAAKVLYEVLGSLEVYSTEGSHAATYLMCASGTLPPAGGHLLSSIMHSITMCWPGTNLSADDPLEEREVPMFLKLLYSNDDGVFTLALDGLVHNLIMGTNRTLTRSAVREYFARTIEDQTEHTLVAQSNLLAKKSLAIQWAELDYEDFSDVNHSLISDLDAQYSRFLYACCVLNKATRMPPREVAYIAVLAMREQRL